MPPSRITPPAPLPDLPPDSPLGHSLAAFMPGLAAVQPELPAVIAPAGRAGGQPQWARLTFAQFHAEQEAFARGLAHAGVERGMRVVFLVRPGLVFLPLTYALFQLGAVPVLIDPGMGRRNLLRCIAHTRPQGFIGVPAAHLARLLFPKYFREVRVRVTIGRRWLWGGADLDSLRAATGAVPAAAVAPEDLAAIAFTTGSTGPPKGVEYTHGMFVAQRQTLGEAFSLGPEDVDMPGFALFALYSVSMGATVVLPDMDPTRPANVVPERIFEAVTSHGATFSFGSPALWRRVAEYARAAGKPLPTLRQVAMAGAPIPPSLHQSMLGHVLAPGAEVLTPYGATESLATTCFRGSDVLAETWAQTRRGRGYCVGRPFPGVSVKIVRLSDAPIPRLADVEELLPGDIGEIIVQSPMVSRRYFAAPEQDALHKIYETADPEGPFWHRIGDLGYLDDWGRLWFCGRKSHRVITAEGTLYTVCCEAIFNEHPKVARSALVGVGAMRQRQRPVIVVEPEAGQFPRSERERGLFVEELRQLAVANPLTEGLDVFLFHRAFPVDIRHNAKIFREKLAVWAATRLRRGTGGP